MNATAEPGPGKYDYACTMAREATNARAVLLIVLGGDQGSGFSVQAVDGVVPAQDIVDILRDTANAIEQVTRGQA